MSIPAVEQQVLPMGQLVRRHLALEPEQAIQRRQRALFPLVGLLERLDLPDGRVLRIFGRDVVMAGLCADTTMYAGFHSKRAQCADFLGEAFHGARDLGRGCD
jgi:hypothetical protein